MSDEDIYKRIKELQRQILEDEERTLADIVTKYDFIVGSKELKEKLTEILPKEASIVYSPFIGNLTTETVIAIRKFDIRDLLREE